MLPRSRPPPLPSCGRLPTPGVRLAVSSSRPLTSSRAGWLLVFRASSSSLSISSCPRLRASTAAPTPAPRRKRKMPQDSWHQKSPQYVAHRSVQDPLTFFQSHLKRTPSIATTRQASKQAGKRARDPASSETTKAHKPLAFVFGVLFGVRGNVGRARSEVRRVLREMQLGSVTSPGRQSLQRQKRCMQTLRRIGRSVAVVVGASPAVSLSRSLCCSLSQLSVICLMQ